MYAFSPDLIVVDAENAYRTTVRQLENGSVHFTSVRDLESGSWNYVIPLD
jgi:hypothetical protein